MSDLPLSWVKTPIGDVCEVVGGGTPRTDEPRNFDGGRIPWITPADLSGYTKRYIAEGERNITDEGLEASGARMMPTGTVLFSSRAPIGYVAVASEPLATNQGFKSFVPPEGLSSEYLYYYLKHGRKLALDLASGTTFPEISAKRAGEIPLVLAPSREQQRIVSKLDELFSDLDAGVAALHRAQANLKRYRASVLKAAVEGRLTAEWRQANPPAETGAELLDRLLRERRERWEAAQLARFEGSGKTPPKGWREKYVEPTAPDTSKLPALPEGWCWATFGQCFQVKVGATPSRAEARYWNGDIAWVSSGEVRFAEIHDTREHITAAGLEHSSTQLNPAGSVLLGMIGEGKTRGQAAILRIAACNNQNCAAIWVSETDVEPEFVYGWLCSQYEATRRVGSGNNQPALNKSLVESMCFPLPPLCEQARVAELVDGSVSAARRAEQELELGLRRSSLLRQSVLKHAFTGNLVPQDPHDEPASQLLDRIRAARAATPAAARTRAPGPKSKSVDGTTTVAKRRKLGKG